MTADNLPLDLNVSFSGAPAPRLKSNVHVHLPPNFSAFDNIDHVIDMASSEGISVLGASNYYYYELYDDFAAKAKAKGIVPLFGLEIISLVPELVEAGLRINDPGNPGRMYLCGKGITRFKNVTPKGYGLLSSIRSEDEKRMKTMTREVGKIFKEAGFDMQLDAQAIIGRIAARHSAAPDKIIIQERHIAQAFQEVFFDKVEEEKRSEALSTVLGAECSELISDPVAVQAQIRSSLMKAGKPAFVKEDFLNFEQAFTLILELGGIPCYPTLADGASVRCEFEEDIPALVEEMKKRNLHMAEYIPIRNTAEVLSEYVKAVRAEGIAVVAGTEHNTLDLIPIDPTCVGGTDIPDDIKDIFWEGTCVLTAHLHLMANGKPGFVDSEGNPNADFSDAEQRIRSFADLGARIIAAHNG